MLVHNNKQLMSNGTKTISILQRLHSEVMLITIQNIHIYFRANYKH